MTVTTAIAARFTRPVAGDGADLGAGLAWTTILGADAYALRLGTAPGLGDLLDAADLRATAFETPALPAGQPIYAQDREAPRRRLDHARDHPHARRRRPGQRRPAPGPARSGSF